MESAGKSHTLHQFFWMTISPTSLIAPKFEIKISFSLQGNQAQFVRRVAPSSPLCSLHYFLLLLCLSVLSNSPLCHDYKFHPAAPSFLNECVAVIVYCGCLYGWLYDVHSVSLVSSCPVFSLPVLTQTAECSTQQGLHHFHPAL